MTLLRNMNRLEVLKTFLDDEFIQEKYNISQDDIDNIDLSSSHPNNFIALLQHALSLIENDTYTVNTAASNINSFLDNILE